MPVRDLIDVRVIVDGKEAIEYEDPDAVDGDKRCVRYIETMPGQQFSIKVEWLAGFRLLKADALSCAVLMGNVDLADHNRLVIGSMNQCRGILTEPAILDFTDTILKDPETGGLAACGWAFEGVELINDHCESDLRKFARMQSIGSISISVYRTRKIKLKGLLLSDEDAMIPSPITELPECMFKGKDIKQTIKYINQRPFLDSVSDTADKYKFVPLSGTAGEKFHFIFKHRDRKALQKLGSIPSNPIPPPDPSLLLEQLQRTVELKKRKDREKDRKIAELEAENRVTKREVAALASQMALLLSSHTSEGTDSPDDKAILTPTTSSGETNETEVVRDLQEITNPNPKQKPKPEDIIDLTGDSDSD